MSDTERILQKWPIKLLTVRNQSHRVGNPLEDIEEIDTVVENLKKSYFTIFREKIDVFQVSKLHFEQARPDWQA